jgi:hypothetical protein
MGIPRAEWRREATPRLLPRGLCEGQRHELVFSSSNVAEADVASATQLLVA